jgi:hypothetical protein
LPFPGTLGNQGNHKIRKKNEKIGLTTQKKGKQLVDKKP